MTAWVLLHASHALGQPSTRPGPVIGQPLGSAEHSAHQEPPPEEGEPEPGELFPTLPMASAAGWFLRPEPAPGTREEQAEENLDRYFDDVLQSDRAAMGANPWYHDMGRSMRRHFRPDMRALEEERRAPMNTLERVVDELRRYGRGPEAPIDPPGAMPPELANDHHDPAAQAALNMMDHINLLNAPVTWYRVDLRVTQNPEGEVAGAWVLRSSGYDTLDHSALRAVHDGTVSLPAPPTQVVGARDAIRSDWAFEAGDVATYWNTAGCVDDPVQGGHQCATRGRGIVRTRIRLLGFVDSSNPPFEERRMENRLGPPRLRR